MTGLYLAKYMASPAAAWTGQKWQRLMQKKKKYIRARVDENSGVIGVCWKDKLFLFF